MHSNCLEHENCIESAMQQAKQICDLNNARLTSLRKQVLKLIWAGHEPIKAYDLLSELQKIDPSAKPPTIYRALDFLMEQGLIHKIHRLNAYIGCTSPQEKTPCFFLICTKCHDVTESYNESYNSLIADTSKINNFTPDSMTFEIEGTCHRCSLIS